MTYLNVHKNQIKLAAVLKLRLDQVIRLVTVLLTMLASVSGPGDGTLVHQLTRATDTASTFSSFNILLTTSRLVELSSATRTDTCRGGAVELSEGGFGSGEGRAFSLMLSGLLTPSDAAW